MSSEEFRPNELTSLSQGTVDVLMAHRNIGIQAELFELERGMVSPVELANVTFDRSVPSQKHIESACFTASIDENDVFQLTGSVDFDLGLSSHSDILQHALFSRLLNHLRMSNFSYQYTVDNWQIDASSGLDRVFITLSKPRDEGDELVRSLTIESSRTGTPSIEHTHNASYAWLSTLDFVHRLGFDHEHFANTYKRPIVTIGQMEPIISTVKAELELQLERLKYLSAGGASVPSIAESFDGHELDALAEEYGVCDELSAIIEKAVKHQQDMREQYGAGIANRIGEQIVAGCIIVAGYDKRKREL